MRQRIFQIDVLRSLAVLSVVVYHLDFFTPVGQFLSGGLLGVDIFFVISGFLMTKIIHEEFRAKKFTFSGFYTRRVQRIIPALLTTVILVLLLSYAFIPPIEMKEIAEQASYIVFLVSNIFLYQQDPYIDLSSQLNPFLHTWSLSIEEQFYLFYPLFLITLSRIQNRAVFLCLLLLFGIASFLGFLAADPHSRFYLLQFRIWEFVVGAVAFFCTAQFKFSVSSLKTLAFGLLIIALAVPDDTATSLPLFTLLACAATGFILATPDYSVAAQRKPIKYLANISYSLYLVHWPLIVFFVNLDVLDVGRPNLMKFLVLGTSFIAADASYRFVEKPLRFARPTVTFTAIAVGVTAILATTLVSEKSSGMSFRYGDPDLSQLNDTILQERQNRHESSLPDQCHITKNTPLVDVDTLLSTCIEGDYWVVGDSHAADLFVSLGSAFPKASFSQFTGSQCGYPNSDFCEVYWDTIERLIADNQTQIKGVIYRAEPNSYGSNRNLETIDRLRNLELPLAIMGPGVAWKERWWERIQDAPAGADLNQFLNENVGVTTSPGIYKLYPDYINTIELQCPNEFCTVFNDSGDIMFVDGGHMSLTGSRALGAAMRQRFQSIDDLFAKQ